MFNKSKLSICILLFSLSLGIVEAQTQLANDSIMPDTLSVLFYNVENLFDDVNDSNQGDDEFTKNGLRVWTSFKYTSKINKLSQVILASNNWNSPALIGVSEIENRNVVQELCSNSMLRKIGYKIIHKESKDRRGIDVALMYDPKFFFVIDSNFYEVELNNGAYSRDILYAKLAYCTDTLHVFVCHWPSRYSGALSSELYRMTASNILKKHCVKILNNNSLSKILIMGDFNDEPKDKSVLNISGNLMMRNLMDDEFEFGTLKYHNQWFLFDQFIISNSLQRIYSGLCLFGKPQICLLPFLLIKDEKYLGFKPFRTYSGYKFIGGYSDHLPVLIKLIYFQNNLDTPQ